MQINVMIVVIVVAVCLIGILFAFVRVRHHLLTTNNYFIAKVAIVVAVCLIGILFVFIRVRHHLLTVNNYFINVDDVEEVYSIVASEFIIGESTKTDVENALNDRIFGDLHCFPYDVLDPRILCYALASYEMIMPMNYLIIWRFSGDELIEIIVRVAFPSAI